MFCAFMLSIHKLSRCLNVLDRNAPLAYVDCLPKGAVHFSAGHFNLIVCHGRFMDEQSGSSACLHELLSWDCIAGESKGGAVSKSKGEEKTTPYTTDHPSRF